MHWIDEVDDGGAPAPLMYIKNAKAAMHEIPWNAKPTFSSASVISETLYADKIDYVFSFPLLISKWSYASG